MKYDELYRLVTRKMVYKGLKYSSWISLLYHLCKIIRQDVYQDMFLCQFIFYKRKGANLALNHRKTIRIRDWSWIWFAKVLHVGFNDDHDGSDEFEII